MQLSAIHVISIAVMIIGFLMALESYTLFTGKNVDVNGELPFVAFGTLFAMILPPVAGLLGKWPANWYWYLFLAFLFGYGFLSYIRVRGFTIRVFNGDIKPVASTVDKALKQAGIPYEKEQIEEKKGFSIQYKLGEKLYPILISEQAPGPMSDRCIEVLAPQALWNKPLMHALIQNTVTTSRKNRTTRETFRSVRPKIAASMVLTFTGYFLLVYANTLVK